MPPMDPAPEVAQRILDYNLSTLRGSSPTSRGLRSRMMPISPGARKLSPKEFLIRINADKGPAVVGLDYGRPNVRYLQQSSFSLLRSAAPPQGTLSRSPPPRYYAGGRIAGNGT